MPKLGIALALRKMGAAAWSALIDRRVPLRLKLLTVAAIVFVISPLNILGDLPLLGLVDDAALVSFVLMWFARASAPFQNTFDV